MIFDEGVSVFHSYYPHIPFVELYQGDVVSSQQLVPVHYLHSSLGFYLEPVFAPIVSEQTCNLQLFILRHFWFLLLLFVLLPDPFCLFLPASLLLSVSAS